MITMVLSLAGWAVIPFSPSWVVSDINVGIMYLFAVSSLGVYGVIMAGWAINYQYTFLCALRSFNPSIKAILKIVFFSLSNSNLFCTSSTIGCNKCFGINNGLMYTFGEKSKTFLHNKGTFNSCCSFCIINSTCSIS